MINGGGAKHNRDLAAESGVIINNKSNLIFILFWYSFHLYTYYHIPQWVGLSTHAYEGNSLTVQVHAVVSGFNGTNFKLVFVDISWSDRINLGTIV